MTKKRTTRKKTDAQPGQTATARDGIAVSGGIHAGRDVIMGDQYNDFRQQVAQIGTPAEFVAQVQALQAQLAVLEQQAELSPAQAKTIEVVEESVQQALEAAQEPQPPVARITATLTAAKAVMDSLAGSVQSAVGLGTVLAGLIQVAARLFGG